MTASRDYDVVVVGAGPVGLVAALLLAKQGISVLLLEKERSIFPLPRAAHIDHEIMRIFQSINVADEVASSSEVSTRYEFLNVSGDVLMRFDTGRAHALSGWPPSNMIHQPSIEQVLRARVAACDFVDARFGAAYRDHETSSEVITVHFDTHGKASKTYCRFLIGCDGANSAVRANAGLSLVDLGFSERWLVIDTKVIDSSRLPPHNLQICDPERPTTSVRMGAGRHRWEFMLKAEENEDEVSAPASVANLLSGWDVDGAVELERTATYTFEAKVANQWMQDGVVIAGDAAHLMPPFAGQGLCSGIRDVENLTWKLGAILAGRADKSLLSSYQTEREPHVRAMIDLAVMMGKVVCVTDPEAALARDKNLIETRRANGDASGAIPNPKLVTGLLQANSQIAGELFPQFTHQKKRSDDVFGPGAWLIGESDGIDRNTLRAAGIGVPSLASFSALVSQWLDDKGYSSVLIRPDRVIFGGGNAAELVTAYVEGLYQEARATTR